MSGQKQRTTFAKQQRERARMEKAAEKRKRREDRKLGLDGSDEFGGVGGEGGFDEFGRPLDAFGNVIDPLARPADPLDDTIGEPVDDENDVARSVD
jgi:hypothetical protein